MANVRSTSKDADSSTDTTEETKGTMTAAEIKSAIGDGVPAGDLPEPAATNDADTDAKKDVGLGADREIFPGGKDDLTKDDDAPNVVVGGPTADERNRTHRNLDDNDKRYETDSSGAFINA